MPSAAEIREVREHARASAESVLGRWLPGGKRQGREYVARNPTRSDEHPGSFSVNLDSGRWADFASGDKGGDLVSLVAYLDGTKQGEAAETLARFLGLKVNGHKRPRAAPDPEPEPTLGPIPIEARATRPRAHPQHGAPSATWTYRNPEGRPLAFVLRFDPPQGRKQFAPLTWTPSGGWRWKAPPAPRPLYGLDRLAARPEVPALICEGEKAADAAAALMPEAAPIATMNGAQAPGKSDLSPLKGRRVLIWPDNDDPGAGYAATVAGQARAAGAASVEVLDLSALARDPASGEPRDLPKGWDAADALADGWTPEALAECGRWTAAATPQENPQAGLFPPTHKRPCYWVLDDWADQKGKRIRPGVYWCTTETKDGEPVLSETWFCSPLHVEAVTFDSQSNNFGRLLRFKNTLGHWREWAMPMDLLRGSGEELRGELLAMGVELDPYKARQLLSAYLQHEHPNRRMHCALQTGWAGESFVLPDAVIGPTASETIFQSGERGHEEHTKAGSLHGWRDQIAAPAVGNPLLMLAESAGFAGPMLARCNAESGGLHFAGDSSTGKTTLIEAACSIWGGPNYRRSWRATANGMEGAAALFNDCLLALDEISECDPREIGAIVYALGNGRGKQRASRTGAARGVARWRCFILSSGERTLATAMHEGGRRAKAGQAVRLLDVPAARAFGAFDHLHDYPSGAALADAIKRAAVTHHGQAGRAFLERLTADPRDFAALLEQFKAVPLFAAGDGEGQDKRAAARFALVGMAGELATEYGLTGWTEGEAVKAAALGFDLWRSLRGKGNDERRQILGRVSAFLDRHGDGRFSAINGEGPPVRDRAGWWRETPAGREFLFTAEAMREALAGFDFKRALDALQEVGALETPGSNGERAKFFRVGGRGVKLYPIAPDKLDGGDHGA